MEDQTSFKKLSPEEIEAIVERVQRGEFEDFSPMTDQQREERLEALSPRIKKKYGDVIAPPYDQGYALSEMEKMGNPDVVARMLEASKVKDEQEEAAKKRFDKIKSIFGL